MENICEVATVLASGISSLFIMLALISLVILVSNFTLKFQLGFCKCLTFNSAATMLLLNHLSFSVKNEPWTSPMAFQFTPYVFLNFFQSLDLIIFVIPF